MRYGLGILIVLATGLTARADEFFEKQVRPLLLEHCVSCHGPEKQKAGLRLDSKAGWQAGGDSGPAVVPGDPEKSRLVKAIRGDGLTQMPPKGKLPDRDIATLTKWIKTGRSTRAPARPGSVERPSKKRGSGGRSSR